MDCKINREIFIIEIMSWQLLFSDNLIIFITNPRSVSIKIPSRQTKEKSRVFPRHSNSDERVFRISSSRRSRAVFRALFRHEIGRFLLRSRHGRAEKERERESALKNETGWKERERNGREKEDEGPERSGVIPRDEYDVNKWRAALKGVDIREGVRSVMKHN